MRRVPSRFLRGRLSVEPRVGTTGNGRPAYGPASVRPIPARIEGRRRRIQSPDGSDVISPVTCYLQPDTPDRTDARVTILRGPAHLVGRRYRVAEVASGEGLTDTVLVEWLLDGPV